MEITKIKNRFQTRKINQQYVDFLAEDFKQNGFKNAYPVSITEDGILWDGNHRVEAALKIGLTEIPHIIETPENMRFEAHERNRVATNALPETFVDHAEEIWAMLADGITQQAVAEEKKWTQQRVGQFSKLKDIDSIAWNMITTEINKSVVISDEGAVVKNTTTVVSENLLRNITSGLSIAQQHILVRDIIGNKITKAEFKKQADHYKVRNKIENYIEDTLKDIDQKSIDKCIKDSQNGMYTREWKEGGAPGEKLNSLIQAHIDEWEKKHSYKIYLGDFREVMQDKIEKDSIDFIITDPPYPKEFLPLYEQLAKQASMVLKPGGSLIVMVGQSYIPEIIAMMTKHINYQWMLSYLTPGGQSVQLFQRKVNTFWKPIIWFVKGEYKGKWVGDVTRSETNNNDKRFHEWGQSESGMLDVIKRFTEPGDMVCDPFLGGGTTGVVSLSLNRKFVGIEKEKEAYETAKERIKKALNE